MYNIFNFAAYYFFSKDLQLEKLEKQCAKNGKSTSRTDETCVERVNRCWENEGDYYPRCCEIFLLECNRAEELRNQA